MSNPKFKVENYTNLGGINSKYSPHLTSPLEFMDIKNFDFQTPGSLTQRWGSTQYMGQTLAGKITALSEYEKLNGTSYVIAGSSGGLWYGATTGDFRGMSLPNMTATFIMKGSGNYLMNGCFKALGWVPYVLGQPATLVMNLEGIFYQGSSLQYFCGVDYDLQNGTADYQLTIAQKRFGGNYGSFAYLVDQMFYADGDKFLKFDGTNTSNVGLPLPLATSLMFSYSTSGPTLAIGFGGTGCAVFYASYVNDRGFESQILPIASIMAPNCGPTSTPSNPNGTIALTMILNTPLGYGISSINTYCYCIQNAYNSSLTFTQIVNNDPAMWNFPFVKLDNFPVSGSTLTGIPLGTTTGNFDRLFNNIGTLANPLSNQYTPLGLTLGTQTPSYYYRNDWQLRDFLFKARSYSKPSIVNFAPQYLEVFDNRLFLAGFSLAPSTVYFSDVKEPEGYLPENSFEVRTNDSDYITAMQSYQTRLYIFKKNSFHVLTGDNPSNFFMQEISPIYGCLNNRSVVIFENLMFFLDRKGVIQYTGANISYASTKIQPIFDRMNYKAALTQACAAHDKLRNQVLFAIPIDGSSTNNITLVYDYIADAWTTHTGYNASIFAEIQGRNEIRRLFYGDYQGRVNWFSASFLSDNGVGISLSFKTRYLHDMGDSVQKQFRRLYVNADQLGSTLTNQINFYQDYGPSIVLGTTLNLGAFQERIEYGVSAKSLAFELLTVNSTNSPLRIHGFTIESRMQRRV